VVIAELADWETVTLFHIADDATPMAEDERFPPHC